MMGDRKETKSDVRYFPTIRYAEEVTEMGRNWSGEGEGRTLGIREMKEEEKEGGRALGLVEREISEERSGRRARELERKNE